jgi:PIN domain nuclease of toxin-antitoxin system
MKFLLDTHVLIWSLENNPLLSEEARTAIIDGRNRIFVSAASVWEISIKVKMGKLSVPDNLAEELEQHRFSKLDIKFTHAHLAGRLPEIHKDPFDRMLIAQAITEQMTIITGDRKILQYHVETLRA